MLFVLIAVKPDPLILSANQKKELFDFIKNTRNKEEYRRVVAVKQKMEGMSYRTIAKNLGVNYRNVYYMIKSYKEYGLDGIRSKRKNAGRIPKISSEKNKHKIKQIVLDSPRSFGYLRNTWSIRLLAAYLTNILEMNVSSMQAWRIIHELGITYKKPKLMLEHEKDYEEKKKTIDNYKKVSSALLKKDSTWIRR
jgi:transposase